MSANERRTSPGDAVDRPAHYEDLMHERVHRILLVSSLYDSLHLAEEGYLDEVMLGHFLDLHLGTFPQLMRASTGADALEEIAASRRIDLVVTSIRVGDMDAVELSRRVRELDPRVPVIALAYDHRALSDFTQRGDTGAIDRVFLWQGDSRILLAMVKYVEDRQNVVADTGRAGVPAIILVEDNVRFYSSFLPLIYTELMKHVQNLISEELNVTQRMRRNRVRPKVLLCSTYEEAWRYFSDYQEHVLGVISDIEYSKDGQLDATAGLELVSRVRAVRQDIPVMLQSSDPENQALAESVHAAFLLKGSPAMMQQLRRFIIENFGFGDFVFRTPSGEVLGRAKDLSTLCEVLETVPDESLLYHAERNHFSIWLKARGEFALAHALRPRQVADFADTKAVRRHLIEALAAYRQGRDSLVVADFRRTSAGERPVRMRRIGGGSLGGKARGLAFTNRLLQEYGVSTRFPQFEIAVPPFVVIGTDVFDKFVERRGLKDAAIASSSDEDIAERFQQTPFPRRALGDLETYLAGATGPLAVRSSGILEDSPSHPFAGVYQTLMLPNSSPDPRRRLAQLVAAVRHVWASTYFESARSFLKMTPHRLAEEKMAVMVQQVVGAQHGTRFYPHVSGVARSHNVYATAPASAEDGVVAAALGLGEAVVGGLTCMRFCPRYPRHVMGFSTVDDALQNGQREFYAIDLGADPKADSMLTLAHPRRFGLDAAETDGTLGWVASTYSPDDHAIHMGVSRQGVRVVDFAPLLKQRGLPFAELLVCLLEIGVEATGTPVEIEFALDLSSGRRPRFGFLQFRPLSFADEVDDVAVGEVPAERVLCRSACVMGHGRIDDLHDVVVVDAHRFDRLRSIEVAQQVARCNAELVARGTPYVLIGVGRWGTADRHLGIPVTWNQIAGARVIVESGFHDLRVQPSQGSHFFQNITSADVGYFTVNPEAGEGVVDWGWLAAQPAVDEHEFVRHVRLERPLSVIMSGKTGEGVILKPE